MADKAYLIANKAKPSQRQLKWQETGFYGLISYGLPVFTGRQYGHGHTPASVFCPEDMNTDLWCETAVSAGMRGLVLTCKHYDGFCLWPSEYTDYSIKNSNWKEGEGDLVKDLSDSCRKYGLKFGVYVTLFDRHEKSYGGGKEYDDYICNILKELLTGYGSIFYVCLDPIVDADERRVQNYDWGRYFSVIREYAPDAVISFGGPDVRWCGNEKGFTREQEWSPVAAWRGIYEDGTSAPAPKKHGDALGAPDIGSRKAIKDETEFMWYPCEVSVPMRSHWFYDSEDKYAVKTKDKLLKLYYNTIGNNSCLMLGLSPDKRGCFDDTDTQILASFGSDIGVIFGANILENGAKISASSNSENAQRTANADIEDSWSPAPGDKCPEIRIELDEEELFDKIVLRENICSGQRIEEFQILIPNEKGKLKPVYEGTTVGFKRICPIKACKAKNVVIRFTSFRDSFELGCIQIN